MISIIVCSRTAPEYDIHERNVRATIGAVDFEYIRIDNRGNTYGICGAYNEGLRRSKGDILLFVHEDVFFLESNWGEVLTAKFEADPSVGMVGLAGTQYLYAHNPAWIAAGQPFMRGRVIHELQDGKAFILTVFSWDKSDAEVVAIDGLFLAIRRPMFNRICFDEQTFTKFHFYDLDISMQVRQTHKIIVTWDILVKHFSGGVADQSWIEAATAFINKWQKQLPATCVTGIPQEHDRKGPMNFDITGKAPQVIPV